MLRLPNRSAFSLRWSQCYLPAALGFLALATSLAGATLAVLHFRWPEASRWLAPCGFLCIALAGIQGKLIWIGHRTGELHRLCESRPGWFWRWETTGPIVCYLAALFVGPALSAGAWFLVLATLWHTAALAPTAVAPAVRVRWGQRLAAAPLGTLGWCVFLTAWTIVAGELCVRLYVFSTGHELTGAFAAQRSALPPGQQWRGRTINSTGYWDDEFDAPPPVGVFRVAAVGDNMLLSGQAETNHLAQIERRMPGVQVLNFGLPDLGPREYAAQVANQVSASQPDLVLMYVSIGDDIALARRSSPWFQREGLNLYQLTIGSWSTGHPVCEWSLRADHPTCDSREEFLGRLVQRLDICVTPISPPLERRWKEAERHLRDCLATARKRGLPSALVLVPAEFQVSSNLCDSLCRHAGRERAELDLDMPQRRLRELASALQVPVIDLLPQFQADSHQVYERNDYHWNAHGNQIAANAVATWLERRQRQDLLANR